MTAARIARRRRWAPPAALARIDWSHPITDRLDSYVMIQNASVRDIVTGTGPDMTLPNPTASPTPRTMGWMQDLGSNGAWWSSTAKPFFSPPFSGFAWTVNPSGQVWKPVWAYSGSGSGNGWMVGTGGVATNLAIVFGNVNDYQFSGLPSAVTEMTIAASVNANGGNGVGYVNGLKVGTWVGVGTPSPPGNGRGLGIAATATAGGIDNSLGRPVGLVAIWRRVITDEEVAQLHTDPFQVLR